MPKPKNAYELLDRVAEHILAEPKRYDQGTWGRGPKEVRAEIAPKDRPACNTQACRAGWIVALHDGLPSFQRRLRRSIYSVADRANEILGFEDEDATSDLFDEDAVCWKTNQQDYAEEGAQGIRDFMEEHETHLKTRKLDL